MPAEKSNEMVNQIKKLYFEQNLPIKKIAKILGVSKNTVKKYAGLKVISSQEVAWEDSINWEDVKKELLSGASYKVLYNELLPSTSLTSFWRACQEKVDLPIEVRIRLNHKPGDRVQIDFADGLYITDKKTSKKTQTQVFVSVLPYSNKMYGCFVWDQKLPTFLECIEKTFEYFKGVPNYVVNDNLKSGVTKAHRYDPDVNQTFCDFSNYYGFAVLPTAPRSPTHKGDVETSVGIIQRDFYQQVRNKVFYTIYELNEDFLKYLEELNNKVMKDYGLSRNQMFEKEKSLLKTLPKARYELTGWKWAKVHPDCHIQIKKCFYSVPYKYVGQTVKVRFGRLIEVFNEDGESIAAHASLNGIGLFSTLDSHYPEAKVAVARFEIAHALSKAKKVGVQTEKLVNHLINISDPYKYLRRIQGILRLVDSGKVKKESLEYACEQSLLMNMPRLRFIQDCAGHYELYGNKPVLVQPKRDKSELYLRQEQ